MKEEQKIELETLIKSLTSTLDEVEEGDGSKINIQNITVETTNLIIDLLANYIRKRSK